MAAIYNADTKEGYSGAARDTDLARIPAVAS
jgi:hypothetical protein